MNFYNEFDAKTAAWLRELVAKGCIPNGVVDERSIEDISPDELHQYTQCHFFAGIGGWSEALRLAGWPEDQPVWTGSCPCQPFSAAGKGGGFADERHLWPAFNHLIGECKPPVVFGEQVASQDGLVWLDLVSTDLEGSGYAFGASDLCAAGIGAPHIRQRLYWVADSTINGRERVQRRLTSQVQENWTPKTLGPWDDAGDPFSDWQKLLATPGVLRMDDGVSSEMVVRPALRGYGNAIVPQVAAEFIKAFIETNEQNQNW